MIRFFKVENKHKNKNKTNMEEKEKVPALELYFPLVI